MLANLVNLASKLDFQHAALVLRHRQRIFRLLKLSGILALQLLQAQLFRLAAVVAFLFWLADFIRRGGLYLSLRDVFKPFVHVKDGLVCVVFKNRLFKKFPVLRTEQ